MSTALLVSTLISVVLPLVVGLVTKSSTPKDVKFVLLALLTAVNVAGTSFLGGVTDPLTLAITAVSGLLVALGSHYGIYKPTGVTDVVQGAVVKDDPEPEYPEVTPDEYAALGVEDVGPEADEAAEEGDAPSEEANPEEADAA